MDACKILDICGLVDLAPCPPPNTNNAYELLHNATRDLTMRSNVTKAIATRCGISEVVMYTAATTPSDVDGNGTSTTIATFTTIEAQSDLLDLKILIGVMMFVAVVLLITTAAVVVCRARGTYRYDVSSVTVQQEHAEIFMTKLMRKLEQANGTKGNVIKQTEDGKGDSQIEYNHTDIRLSRSSCSYTYASVHKASNNSEL
ncbi:uncharacterized protein LOC128209046 [Mya arenaria]|uniref:uncharacterized protein LOC128209046 n=1 Tax=Mya arenaria TaxID=6604 RepID=UPI0022E87B8B|nr:uncharacterized protein LOC128209046 [Mya arenaria]XP_052768825.1 uncharacterized protein LOC128209046 [Mya arenaria]